MYYIVAFLLSGEMRQCVKVHSYYNKNGTDLIRKYINELTLDEQIDAYDVLEQLEKGCTCCQNQSEGIGEIFKKLKELKKEDE